jgi:hypothetical protein
VIGSDVQSVLATIDHRLATSSMICVYFVHATTLRCVKMSLQSQTPAFSRRAVMHRIFCAINVDFKLRVRANLCDVLSGVRTEGYVTAYMKTYSFNLYCSHIFSN